MATPDAQSKTVPIDETNYVGRTLVDAKGYSEGSGARGEQRLIALMLFLETLCADNRIDDIPVSNNAKTFLNYKFSEENSGNIGEKSELIKIISEINSLPQEALTDKHHNLMLKGLLNFWTILPSENTERVLPIELTVKCREYESANKEIFSEFTVNHDQLLRLLKEKVSSLTQGMHNDNVGLTGLINKRVVPFIAGFEHHVEASETHTIKKKYGADALLKYRNEPLPFEGNLHSVFMNSLEDWATYFLASKLNRDPFPTARYIGIKEDYNTQSRAKRDYFDCNEITQNNCKLEHFINTWVEQNWPEKDHTGEATLLKRFNPNTPNMLSAARDLNTQIRAEADALIDKEHRHISIKDRLSTEAAAYLNSILPEY